MSLKKQYWWLSLALLSCTPDQNPPDGAFTVRDQNTVARVSVPDSEPRSLGTYHAEVTWSDGTKGTIQAERDGTIDGVWLVDLDSSGTPELVVATSVVGSGAYGDLQVYQRAGGALTRLDMPPLDDPSTSGYMGHDVFSIRDGRIYRSYPLYREGDSNAEPTGGNAVFWYSLADRMWISQPDKN